MHDFITFTGGRGAVVPSQRIVRIGNESVKYKTRLTKMPENIIKKGDEISELTALPRTKAFGIWSEGISMPTKIEVQRIPRTKKKRVVATWVRELEIK